jgi:hypothetical protein
MRFPIKFRGETTLLGNKCNYCEVGTTSPEFVSFHVGATQDYADAIVDLSQTFAAMQFRWQGRADSQEVGFGVVDETANGSCILNFCSTICLRRFFIDCVDHLEHLIATTKAASPGHEDRQNAPSDKPD